MEKSIYVYGDIQGRPLEVTYYPAKIKKDLPVICYFHGGGLIYGDRDDLPPAYIAQFTERGYGLLTIDYPFVPEVKIDTIFKCLEIVMQWFLKEHQKIFNLQRTDFIYFGRSAGAYLALLLSAKSAFRPAALISFYGYHSLVLPELCQSSRYYQKFPPVPYMDIHRLIRSFVTTQSTIEERFPIYLAYRQTGNWMKEIYGQVDPQMYSLSQQELKNLPSTFLAVSRADQDIPYDISINMSKQIPQNEIYVVDDLPHDFDRNPNLETSKELYCRLISWLDSLFL